jgi:site-specific recombinase XerD
MNSAKYIQDFERDLRFIHFSNETIKNYGSQIKLFLNYFKTKDSPKHISSDEIKDYMLNAKEVNSQNAMHSAIKKFYILTIKQHRKFEYITYAKKEKKIPLVIDMDELVKLVDKIENKKHKAIMALTSSVGLRVSEVLNLKLSDINSPLMQIKICGAKGKKDRIVPLTEKVREIIRLYYIEYLPKEYLFNGQYGFKYSDTSCNNLVKKYIGKQYHMHTLRHSVATGLFEKGTDLKLIGDLLGHASRKTTEIYTHTSSKKLQSLQFAI